MCGEFILKLLIAIFNSIVALLGLACVVIGALVAKSTDMSTIAEKIKTGELLHGTYLLIGVGAVVFIIALMGCCGAMMGNKCLLLSYFIIVSIILIAELVGAGIVWKNRGMLEKTLDDTLKKEFKNYYKDKPTRLFIDTIQKNLKCCGVDSPADYANMTMPNTCKNPDNHITYEFGCLAKIKSFLSKAANMVGGVALGLVGLQIFSLASVLCLFCLLRKTISSVA